MGVLRRSIVSLSAASVVVGGVLSLASFHHLAPRHLFLRQKLLVLLLRLLLLLLVLWLLLIRGAVGSWYLT